MFRIRPNGCTKRHMEQPNRAGPCLRKSRGDPHRHLRLIDAEQNRIVFEETEKLQLNQIQKERKS